MEDNRCLPSTLLCPTSQRLSTNHRQLPQPFTLRRLSAQNESESDDASVEVPLTSENIGSLRNNLLPVSNTAPWDDLSTVNGGTTVHSAATRDTQQSSATKKSQYGQQLEPSEIV